MSASATGLPPCPESPNCVSSQASDASHRVEPFTFDTRPELALQRLKQAIEPEPRITLVKEEGGYLHAEARSFLFRFVDDIEFMLDANSGWIHVRSASRTGHSDFGVNRRRVERIRRSFNEIP